MTKTSQLLERIVKSRLPTLLASHRDQDLTTSPAFRFRFRHRHPGGSASPKYAVPAPLVEHTDERVRIQRGRGGLLFIREDTTVVENRCAATHIWVTGRRLTGLRIHLKSEESSSVVSYIKKKHSGEFEKNP